jgi:cyclic pyranopterin phosphate synthase
MNNVDFPLADLLKGIAAAQDTGFALIKINIVVKKGVNDQNIGTITRRLQDSSHTTHFIKLMDAGASYGWRMNDVVPSFKTMRIISAETPLIEAELNSIDEVAERWAYANGNDEIGIIFSVPQTFFSTYTRARLSTMGKLYTYLFSQTGYGLRTLMRSCKSNEQSAATSGLILNQREAKYSEIHTEETIRIKKIMISSIGG